MSLVLQGYGGKLGEKRPSQLKYPVLAGEKHEVINEWARIHNARACVPSTGPLARCPGQQRRCYRIMAALSTVAQAWWFSHVLLESGAPSGTSW